MVANGPIGGKEMHHFRTEQKTTTAKGNHKRSLINAAFSIDEDEDDDAIDDSQLLSVQ